jgi:hypothetical protein
LKGRAFSTKKQMFITIMIDSHKSLGGADAPVKSKNAEFRGYLTQTAASPATPAAS